MTFFETLYNDLYHIIKTTPIDSKLIYIENCGHMAPLEQPDIINQMLSGWL